MDWVAIWLPKPAGQKGNNMKLVNWQYCKNLNDINYAIKNNDDNWDGLKSAEQIISITFDTNHGCYVVIWVVN